MDGEVVAELVVQVLPAAQERMSAEGGCGLIVQILRLGSENNGWGKRLAAAEIFRMEKKLTDIPARFAPDGRSATWNPASTRSSHVILHIRQEDGSIQTRRSVNSGRARVQPGEQIEKVVSGEA